MIKKLYLPLVALLVLALSSCGKMGELSSDYFTTNPEVLEAIGGKVPVTINGKFPEKYFKKNATVEVTPVLRWKGGEALGNLYIKQGQYDRAVNSFGDAKTNSAAQAQILAKDYNKAKATLSAIKNPDAMTDYLMAIVGARTNNASLVSSSIKSAIAKDPSMAEKAANDREFAKYADAIK